MNQDSQETTAGASGKVKESLPTPGPWEWSFGEPAEPAAGLRGFPPFVFANCPSDCVDGKIVEAESGAA